MKRKKIGRLMAAILAMIMVFSAIPVQASSAELDAQAVLNEPAILAQRADLASLPLAYEATVDAFVSDFLETVLLESSLIEEAIEITEELLLSLGFEERGARLGYTLIGDQDVSNADILLATLGESLGVSGFEGAYALTNPSEIVEVVVTFVTPATVALRLVAEDAFPLARFDTQVFETLALEAHSTFDSQLDALVASNNIEVFGRHNTLFNGVYMRVPAYLVDQIAALPEVFAVTPNITFYAIGVLEAAQYNNNDCTLVIVCDEYYYEAAYCEYEYYTYNDENDYYSENDYYYNDNDYYYDENDNDNDYYTENDDYYEDNDYELPEVVLTAPAPTFSIPDFSAQSEEYVGDGEFNLGAIELFNMPYIHDVMNVRGAGISVAVLDTGIDYRHPRFAPFRFDPADPNSGMPGANFVPDQGRPVGLGTSPNEGTTSNHGTHVAGTVIAMAPDITLYGFRVLGNVGGSIGNSVMRGIEAAYLAGVDVMNLSLGSSQNAAWAPNSMALNAASLAGIVVATSAGNAGAGSGDAAGVGGWFSLGTPGTSSLAMAVGATQAGGRAPLGEHTYSYIDGVAMPIRILGFPGAMATELGIMSGQTRDYVFFGQLQELPDYGDDGFEESVIAISETHLGGGDLTGRIAIIARGASNFTAMTAHAYALNADALIIVNNAGTGWITGVTVDGLRPYNLLPTYNIRQTDAELLWDGLPGVRPEPGTTGTIQFGQRIPIMLPENIATFTSVGPVANTHHIGVDIMAPGVAIWSTNNTNLGMYVQMGGTSMSSPAIAGISALVLDHFNLTDTSTRAAEVKARLMNTSRPLVAYEANGSPITYSVMQVGAGLVQPIEALTTTAFATTEVYVPWLGGEWRDDTAGVWTGGAYGTFAQHTKASLDFGITYGTVTNTLTVTITGGAGWSAAYDFIVPTQPLTVPPGRNPVLWGPPLPKTSNASMSITNNGNNTFDIYITGNELGFAQGYVTFTNGSETLTMPFGANFVEAGEIAWDPDFNSIIRPIISNFVTTRYNYMDEDPRGHGLGDAAIDYFTQNPNSDAVFVTQSNVSNLALGFTCPHHIAREARFYIGPYGQQGVYIPSMTQIMIPNMRHYYVDLLSPIVRDTGWHLWSDYHLSPFHVGVYRLTDVTEILEAGVYTLTIVIDHDVDGFDGLEQSFTFVIADESPELDFDDEPFTFAAGDTTVTITGTVVSEAHTLAMAHDLYVYTLWNAHNAALRTSVPFDFSTAIIYLEGFPNQVTRPEADGTFSITLPVPPESIFEEVSINLIVEDGFGRQSTPVAPGVTLTPPNWPWVSSMVSEVQTAYIAIEDLDLPGLVPTADFFHSPEAWANPGVGVRFAGGATNIVSVSLEGATLPETAWSLDTTQDPPVLYISYEFLAGITPEIYGGDELVFTVLFNDAANTAATFIILVHTPLTPMDNTGIWRPILSNWVAGEGAPANQVGANPRDGDARSFVGPGVTLNAANYSSMTFGFNDASGDTARPVRFYVGPYGTPIGEKLFVAEFPTVPANSYAWSANIIRTAVGGSLGSNAAAPELLGVTGGTVLGTGLHTVTVSVGHDVFDPLLMTYNFVVIHDRPTVEYDEELFVVPEGGDYVTITGRINSEGHDLAIANDLQGAVNVQIVENIPVPTFGDWDYTNAWFFATGSGEIPVNADGTFSFERAASADSMYGSVDVTSQAIDGDGIVVFGDVLQERGVHFSLITPFTYVSYEYIAWREWLVAVEEAEKAYQEYREWRAAVEEAERLHQEYLAWRALLDLVAYLEWRAEIERLEREYAEYRLWRAAIEQAAREYQEWRDWLCATGQCDYGCDNCD